MQGKQKEVDSVPFFSFFVISKVNNLKSLVLYPFPRAALIKNFKISDLQQKFIIYSFEGQNAKSKLSAGLCSLQGLHERISFASFSFWRLQDSLATAASLQSLPQSLPGLSSLCLCLLFFCLVKTTVFGFRALPNNPEHSHLKILNYIFKDPFSSPNQVTFTGSRGQGMNRSVLPMTRVTQTVLYLPQREATSTSLCTYITVCTSHLRGTGRFPFSCQVS